MYHRTERIVPLIHHVCLISDFISGQREEKYQNKRKANTKLRKQHRKLISIKSYAYSNVWTIQKKKTQRNFAICILCSNTFAVRTVQSISLLDIDIKSVYCWKKMVILFRRPRLLCVIFHSNFFSLALKHLQFHLFNWF